MKKFITAKHIILGAVLFVFLAGIRSAQADGFRNPPESASALGRIGGKIVHINDASAAIINPANITDIEKPSIMVVLTTGYASKEFESAINGSKEDTKDPLAFLPSIFATIPAGDVYTFGLGITVPFGRHSEWEKDAVFSTASPYYSELSVINFNPSVARKFGENVSVGVGMSIYQSSLQFKQVLPWSVMTGNAASPSGIGDFEGDGTSFGVNFGVTWDIVENHSVALTYRSPFDVTYKGDFDVTETPAEAGTVGVTSHSDFETEFKFPTVVSLGYGIEVTDKLRVEFDVEWVEASRNKEFVVDIENNNVLVAGSPAPYTIPQNWDDNWTFGLGADYQCTDEFIIRAGYMYLEAPSSTSTMIPVASEENQSVISIGAGYTHNAHTIDVAYVLGIFSGITVADNANSAINGGYEHQSHLLSVAYGYQF